MRPLILLVMLIWAGSAVALPKALPKAKTSVPKLAAVIQEGHPWDGSQPQFALSPDGKWVVSSSETRFKLWNTRGELLCDLQKPQNEAHTPVFARDSRHFFLTGPAETAVYALPTGHKIRDIKGAELSSDARFFIRRTEKAIRFSNAKTGKQLATITAHSNSHLETLDFSPDGRLVAAGQANLAFSDGKMRIWNVKTGTLVRTLSDPRGGFGNSTGVVGPALWSSDGKTIVTGGEDPNWQIPGDDGGPQTPAFFAHAYAVKVWSIPTGQLRHVWPGYGDNENGVPLREFLTLREVSLGSYYNLVLDIETGKMRRYARAPPSKSPQIVDSGGGEILQLRDRSGQKTLQHFPLPALSAFRHMAYSPDGSLMAAESGGDFTVKIYNARTGALQTTVQAGGGGIKALRWLSNGNLSASTLQSGWIWAPDGQVVRHFVPPAVRRPDSKLEPYSDSVSVSPDGQLFLSGADIWGHEKRSMGHVWNQNGELLRDIPDLGANGSIGWHADSVVWLDGSRVAFPTQNGFEVWNLKAGTREKSVEKANDWKQLRPVIAAPDGSYLLASEDSGNDLARERTVLLDTETWQRTKIYEDIVPLSWSGDSTQFVARRQNGQGGTLIFSPHSEEPLQKLPLEIGLEREIAFSPDLKFAVLQAGGYYSYPTHSEVRRVATGQLAVSIYLFADENRVGNSGPSPDTPRFWLALTPDNFYDGSPGVEKWLR